jgi:hypothetical protein
MNVDRLRIRGRRSKCAPNLRLETPLPHLLLLSSNSVMATRPSAWRVLNRGFSVLPATLGCGEFLQLASVSTKWVRNRLIRVFS